MVVCINRIGYYTGRWTDTEQGKPIVVVGRFARTIKRKQLLDLRCRMQTAGLLYKTIISYKIGLADTNSYHFKG